MANTYTQIYLHVVFAVEGRQNLIKPEHNDELQKYITGIVSAQKHKLIAVNNMPDHIHLFCAPNGEDHTLERWISFWKRRLRRQLKTPEALFQAHSFHHRLRRDENYSEKWEYIRMNPVRAGLVSHPDQWPYQGILNELPWWN